MLAEGLKGELAEAAVTTRAPRPLWACTFLNRLSRSLFEEQNATAPSQHCAGIGCIGIKLFSGDDARAAAPGASGSQFMIQRLCAAAPQREGPQCVRRNDR